MRILHCIPSMRGGGAERQLTYLAQALRGLGCDVHVALNEMGPNYADLQKVGATIHPLDLRGNHDLRLVNRLRKIMLKVRPDVVQCWLTQMQIAGGLAAMMLHIPWVFSERASAEAYPRTWKNILRARIGSAASAIVSNSTAGDRYWATRASSRVPRYVIRNGLPIDDIAGVAPATSASTGIAAGEPLVLFAGRFDEQKNAAALVHALSRVRLPGPLHAIMCGDGPLRHEVETLVRTLGLESTIDVVGYHSHLWSLMKRANVLVSTSLFEGNPNVVLEAMAIGLPLVVSDISTHREFLDERSAILVSSEDPEALARSIESVIADPEAARKRAAVAAAWARAQTPHRIAEQYLDVYHAVLSRAERPLRSPAV